MCQLARCRRHTLGTIWHDPSTNAVIVPTALEIRMIQRLADWLARRDIDRNSANLITSVLADPTGWERFSPCRSLLWKRGLRNTERGLEVQWDTCGDPCPKIKIGDGPLREPATPLQRKALIKAVSRLNRDVRRIMDAKAADDLDKALSDHVLQTPVPPSPLSPPRRARPPFKALVGHYWLDQRIEEYLIAPHQYRLSDGSVADADDVMHEWTRLPVSLRAA